MNQPQWAPSQNGRADHGSLRADNPGIFPPRQPTPDRVTGWDGAPEALDIPVDIRTVGGDIGPADAAEAMPQDTVRGSDDRPTDNRDAGDPLDFRSPDAGGDDDLADEGEEDEEVPEPVKVLTQIIGLLGGAASGLAPGIGIGDVQVRGQNATGYGATAIGTLNNHIQVLNRGPDGPEGGAWCEVLPAERISELTVGYARAPSDDQLDERLRRRHLVCLTGRPGTGRYTAACLALARRHGANRVGVLVASRLSDLTRPDAPLRKGVGHLLRLDPERHEADGLALVGLAARVTALGASLVIVGDFDRHDGELADELLEHRPAQSRDVFRAQLRHRLHGRCLGACPMCVGACADEYLDREVGENALVNSYLASAQRPAELVAVVDMISRTAPRGPALDELLGRVLPQQLRQRARLILTPEPDEVRAAGTGDADSLRAFRLACAVLDGLPIVDIWRAAQRLHSADPNADPVASAGLRQPDLGPLLGGSLRQAVALADDHHRLPETWTIRFSPTHQQLRAHLLDVAWSEWRVSGRLLRWLTELIQTETPAIRQAAAGTIGRAAMNGIGPALAVVNELSRDPRPGIRQAAGIALVAIAVQPPLRRRIRAEIARWAAGSTRQRDTVARACALGLGQIWPDVAVDQLRRAAEARMQRWNNSVVRGLVAVYQGGNPALVLTALVKWTRTPDHEVRLHAARTLRVLADRWAAPPRSHWPELLDLVRIGTLPLADVAAVWAVALSLPATAHRCWRTLGFWLNRAESDPELSGLCMELLRRTITSPPLRRRLEHQVIRIWRPIMPHNQLLHRVATLTIAS